MRAVNFISNLPPVQRSSIRHTIAGLLCILSVLSGCSQHTRLPDTAYQQLERWEDHQSQMLAVKKWHIKGKFGYKSPSGGGSAWLNWHRENDTFSLHLNGPLGIGAVQIAGDNDQVTMRRANQPVVYASSLEALSGKLFDWNLPIDELSYWILGIPSPKTQARNTIFNKEGLLKSFQQANWQIELSRYQESGAGKLPGKLLVHRGKLKFTLVIKEYDYQAVP